MDVFLKDKDGFPILTKQWAGGVFVPDFTHPNASQYWINQFQKFNWPFDGIWIDMNEVSNFAFGKYNISEEYYLNNRGKSLDRAGTKEQQENEIKQFVRLPLNQTLTSATIDIFQPHYDGNIELYHHNIFNLYEQEATFKALQQTGHQLPFIISRSNTLNSHKYSFIWLGDNQVSYFSIRNSIQGIMRSNFYGIQMVGADICGFNGESNDKICARWY